MALNNPNSAEFGALLKGLAQDVVNAHIHWDQLMTLENQLKKHPDVWAEANTFWYYTRYAHREAALVTLARVFDQQSSALHLLSWLNKIKANLHLFDKSGILKRRPDDPFAEWMLPDAAKPDPVVLEQDIMACSYSDPDVKALMKYRNNLLAHRGEKLASQGDMAALPTLSTEQVEKLLERAKTLLNRYSYMFDSSLYATKPIGHDDVAHVFNRMQRDLDRQKT